MKVIIVSLFLFCSVLRWLQCAGIRLENEYKMYNCDKCETEKEKEIKVITLVYHILRETEKVISSILFH